MTFPSVAYTEQTGYRELGGNGKKIKHSIRYRVLKVCEALDNLWLELQDTYTQIHELEALGVSPATVHWRRAPEPDKPGIMELLHPWDSAYHQTAGGRREYIGTDLDKQKEARARVNRWKKYQALKDREEEIKRKMTDIQGRIGMLEYLALGQQDQLGDIPGFWPPPAVPKG